MTRKRTPLAHRRPRWHVSRAAIDAYREMLARESQCNCGGNGYECCPAARRWWQYHQVLRLAVHAPPWVFPVTRDEDLIRALDEAIEKDS
jgi:hypothetical protein